MNRDLNYRVWTNYHPSLAPLLPRMKHAKELNSSEHDSPLTWQAIPQASYSPGGP